MASIPYNLLVISGISGRYPEAQSLEEFWFNLLNGVDGGSIDDRRWPTNLLNIPKRLAKVPNIGLFDVEFFKIPTESVSTILPSIRVLHEVIYEMFIDAGFIHDSWRGTNTGLFAGVSASHRPQLDGDPLGLNHPESINWLHYVLDLKGPVISVDTACAAAASAFDIAARSILFGDCDQAIVLAHNHCVIPYISLCFRSFGMTSIDGKSKCLDADANGYLRSESIVAILIQRKSDAKRVYGSLINIVVNNDGFTKEGITFPRLEGQIDVLRRLFKDVHLDPEDIDYVEAHVTGTAAGDPIECKALMETMRPNSDKPLLVGCLKSNIGHSEGSSVLNAISKVVKIFQTGVIPANLHFIEPNPNIDGLIKGVIRPILENTRFDGDHIMVNAFGFGGVNTTFILQANSKRIEKADLILSSNKIPRLVNFCNRTYEGLETIVDFIEEEKGSLTKYTLALLDNMSKIKPSTGFDHRGYLLLDDEQTVIHQTFKQNVSTDEVFPWLIFTPMFNVTSQSFVQLLEVPLIYSRIRSMQTDRLSSLGIDVIKIIESNQQDLISLLISSIVIQIALCDLLTKHLEIKPKGIIGHSIGSIAASYADGCITDEDALLIGYHIGFACEQLKRKGAMAYVNLPWRQIEEMNFGCIEVASHESEDWTLITGTEDAIEKSISKIESNHRTNIKTNLIDTKGIPFNSSLLSEISKPLELEINKFLRPLKTNSGLNTHFCENCMNSDQGHTIDGHFFVSCITESCNFSGIIEKIDSNSVLLEISSNVETRQSSIFLINGQETLTNIYNYNRSILHLYKMIGQIYLHGLNPMVTNLYDQIEYPVPRETQPVGHLIKWKHEKEWFDAKYDKYSNQQTELIKIIDLHDPSWSFLTGHQIDGRILFPATGYLYVAWQMVCRALNLEPNENPIEFYQVQILRATQFTSTASQMKFVTKINEDLETFLIYVNESKNVCISGKYRLVDKPTVNLLPADFKNIKESSDVILQKNDIYKELRIRGYDYSGSFQGVEEASSNGKLGIVKDTGHWISFSDACLQVSLLASKSRKLIVPVYIDYVYMFPPETLSAFSDETVRSVSDSTKVLSVYFNQETRMGLTNGFILKGLEGEEIRRKINTVNHQIRNHNLIPLNSYHKFSNEKAIRQQEYSFQCSNLIENIERLKSRKLELIDCIDLKPEINESDEAFRQILNEILDLEIQQCKSPMDGVDFNSNLDNVLNKYHDALCHDFFFYEPENILYEQILSIARYNLIKKKISIAFCNFSQKLFENEIENIFNDYGFTTMNNFIKSDSNLVYIQNQNTENSSESKLYDFVIIRDKSTLLMYKDTEPGVKCNQYDPLLKNLFDSLKEGGFCQIMTRTKLRPVEQEWQQLIGNNQQINFDLSTLKSNATDVGFTWICHKEMIDEGYCSVLLRRPFAPNPDQQVTFIRVKLDSNYDWIDKIKELSKDKNHKIWLTGGGYDNGIIGFIMCLVKDPQYNLRCYYDPKKGDDEEIIVPDEVMERDLIVNEVDDEGEIGLYKSELVNLDDLQIKTISCYADIKTKGDLSSLRWFQSHHSNWTHIPKNKLIEDHEKIKIYYGSLNFRDILVATGRVPLRSYPLYDSVHYMPSIGIEFSGINSSGERVMGICNSSGLATSSIIQSNSSCIFVPEHWTLAEAATVPVVYLTAYYGLISRGNLQSGESVLIHAGSGGVGQAAISICLSRGCQVFTTVGTQEKRDFIKKRFPSINDDHIGDSRSTSFEDMVMKMTDGRGVDLVLNSLSDDKLKASIRCLSNFGRFIEIGKYDMIQNTKIDSQFIDFNKTFHACCLAFLQEDVFIDMIPDRITIWNNLIEILKKGIESGEVVPLPTTIFQMHQLEESFRFMATGKHIGKVLIQMRDENEDPNKVKLYRSIGQTFFDLKKSYIITGGLGGLGLEIAYWMVSRGATNLILTSRSGIKTKYQEYILNRLENNKYTYTNIIISNEDCSNLESTERLINQAQELGQIGEYFIFLWFKDGLFENQTAETFDEAVKPKAIACRYLDQLTRSLPYDIDYFVCFSSIAVEVGNIAQANYCFGNTAMENICRKRRLDGLHGLAIRWGVIGDVGIFTEMRLNRWQIHLNALRSYEPIRLNLVRDSLDKILMSSGDSSLFTIVSFSDKKSASSIGNNYSLKQKIFHILSVKDATKVDPQSTLSELGLDSLMAVEIKQALDTDYDYSMTTNEIRELKVGELDELEKKLKKSEKKKINSSFSITEHRNIFHIDTQLFVPLNQSEFGLPYFYFPSQSGRFHIAIPVFESFSKPVIGISWNKDCQNLESIDEVVNFYVDSFIAKYPNEKTFNLIGFCLGGVIALKVAIGLQKKLGQDSVRNLIMIDSSPEKLSYETRIAKKEYEGKDENTAFTYFTLNYLSPFMKSDEKNEVRTKLFELKTKQEKLEYVTATINRIGSFEYSVNQISDALDIFADKVRKAADMNVDEIFNGEIVLIRVTDSDENNADFHHLEDYGLSKYTNGAVIVFKLPGQFNSMTIDNAKKITDILEAVAMKSSTG
ncbi:LOW QUALITY PROTEIN: fatty acid synthase-like [Panonychus citri]|uniref:LOW QUALITY PROTEIN: fatty acid synthase-like n=1 Tax=Panonychus citri TaxID=50023 RepID=UPI002307D29E|nr:LOW QUALITY PROTEIN: fatty acid synthase-like [Panonychus citri]